MFRKIFVSNRAGIGDVILTIPVLKALKEKFPTSKLVFMIGPHCREVVNGLDFIDEILVYDKKSDQSDSMWKIIKTIWRYDVALCLDFKYRSAVIAFLAGIPLRAGLKHKRKLFMTHPVNKRDDWEQNYEANNYANVIKDSVGIELATDLTQLDLPKPTQEDIHYIDTLYSNHALHCPKRLIAIAPFTSWLPKDWPIQYYIKLITTLTSRQDCEIVLIGTKGDVEKADPLTELPSVINVMGKTSLIQMSEVIRRSAVFIGGCSAPLHIAAAVKTPFVAMYGATSPERWAPRTQGIVLTKHPECGPCNDLMVGCAEKPCMYDISVDEVYSACCSLMGCDV